MSIRFVVCAMLGALVLEVVVLSLLNRRAGRAPRLAALLPNLAAGLFLVLALGSTTLADPFPAVALFVLFAGLAHVWDLATRFRRNDD